jgi:GTP-binding protein HflX
MARSTSSKTHSTDERTVRAVLVGVQLPGVTEAELSASLDELGRLAKTLGLVTVARLTQPRQTTLQSTVLGAGKLRELAALTGGRGTVPSAARKRRKGAKPSPDVEGEGASEEQEVEPVAEEDRADVVLFDHDLTPSQLRNLEGATGAEVLDRSSVIVNIFQRHARTREARLQVEIARLRYLAPRLRATGGGGGDRQRGGIGGKGAGESSLELDRRRVRDRIAELKRELAAVQREVDTRRARRSQQDTVALVGYTNAGKSSLMRKLTGSEVLVRDQLFATLETTVRALKPETQPRILISDTVGFVKKLPHDLVASFRSTLEEARNAALLLYVVDASDAAWRSQYEVTRTVLAELGAEEMESLLVLNKADCLDEDQKAGFAQEFPDALVMSAHDDADVTMLHSHLAAHFERDMAEHELLVPYWQSGLVHTIHESCRVLSETHGPDGTMLTVRATEAMADGFRATLEGRL